MLINFQFENFRCFKKESNLSMIACKGPGYRANHHLWFDNVIPDPTLDKSNLKFDLLKSVMILGQNGGGKSSIIDGLKLLSWVCGNDEKYYTTECPLELSLNFIRDGINYSYDVTLDDKQKKHETLTYYPKRRANKKLPNGIADIKWWFENKLRIYQSNKIHPGLHSDSLDKINKKELLSLLHRFDTNICEIMPEDPHHGIIFKLSNNALKSYYGLSTGTQKLVNLSIVIREAIENDHILVIDDLDCHIHFCVLESLLSYWHEHAKQAQLIFTSHSTWPLKMSLIRPDQVYFCETNSELEGSLYSLSDYKSAFKKKYEWERIYRGGGFGAIPMVIY